MKKLLITSTLLFTTALFSNELAWVDEQIEAIKPSRSGMSTKTLNSVKNPFIYLKKEDDKKKSNSISVAKSNTKGTIKKNSKIKKKSILTLSLIMNNSAMINDSWYKKGDKVNGYTITNLTHKSVLLVKNKKKLLLSTRSSSKNLKFNTK